MRLSCRLLLGSRCLVVRVLGSATVVIVLLLYKLALSLGGFVILHCLQRFCVLTVRLVVVILRRRALVVWRTAIT